MTNHHTPADSLGLFAEDSSFYQDEPFHAYQPRFGVEHEDEKVIWLTDQGRRVALVHKPQCVIDLFEFLPGRPRLMKPQMPVLYHAPTLFGARLTLA